MEISAKAVRTRPANPRVDDSQDDAVCALWDDPALYQAMAIRARRIADERYSESVSRKRHVDYFTSLKPGGRPIAGPATTR